MSILERIEATKKLWSVAIPKWEAPEDHQLCRWVSRFMDDEIAYAVYRTARKFSHTQAWDSEELHRYATSVMLKERELKEAVGAA